MTYWHPASPGGCGLLNLFLGLVLGGGGELVSFLSLLGLFLVGCPLVGFGWGPARGCQRVFAW